MPELITLTDKQIAQIEALAQYLTLEQIADHLGICRKTLLNKRNEHPEIEASYRKGKARAIAFTSKSLMKNIAAGKEASIIFFLKTQAGWSESKEAGNDEDDDKKKISKYIKNTIDSVADLYREDEGEEA
jgi:hypothetical protein